MTTTTHPIVDRYAAAINEGDLAAVTALFSDGASLSAAFSGPRAAVSDVLDANRPLVVADTGNQRIRRAQF